MLRSPVAAALALLVLAALVTPRPAFAATTLPALAVSGPHLVSGGAPLALHGVNRSGTEYACIQGWGTFDGPSDAASVQAIAAWGVNVVRVPLNEDCWLGINQGSLPGANYGAAYRSAVVAYVNLLHQNGLYAEVSLMWAAPGANQATDQPAAPDADHSPAMWASMAATFKGDQAVILAPWGETTVSWSCFLNGCSNEAIYGGATYATAGMQQAVTTLRQNGFAGPIAVPCINYANDCGSWLQYEPADPNHALVAEAHIYGNNACGAQNGGACLTSTIAPITQVAPVIFGETGETWDDSECSAANMQVILPWADAHDVGWEAWTWDTWGSCLSLISDYSGTPNTNTPAGAQYAEYVKQHLAGYSLSAGSLGGVLASAPAVASWGPGRLDVFVRGTDNQLWHKWCSGSWSGWESLGGDLTSAPAVAAWAPGRLDVFVRGSDNQLWHKWYAGGWSGWEPLGGVLTTAPAAASWSGGRLDVFVGGGDHQLWHKWYSSGWSGWEPLGGVVAGDPGSVSWGANRVDVLVRGGDGAIWHRWWDGAWHGWLSLGGEVQFGVGADSTAPGTLDAFVTGSDAALYRNTWTGSAWAGWQRVGGSWTSGPAAASPGGGAVDVFLRGGDSGLWELALPN